MMKRFLATATSIAGCGCFVLTGQQAAPPAVYTAAQAAAGAMPVAQQNALVQKYCAVCHTDASMNGGLSLEHFDAAHADPGEAAMMVGKLKAKAMGASGIPLPDKATQDALQSALTAEAAGAGAWTVRRTQNPKTQVQILTASVVRQLPSAAYPDSPDLYRLKLTCRADTHEAEMQLAWSPAVPEQGRVMFASVDGMAPATYKIEGLEKNGNGQAGTSGPGSMVLSATQLRATQVMPLPAQTLTVRNVFPDETVEFPFDDLTPTVRQELSTCFTGSSTSR
jgi:hypothetical protein